MEEKRDIWSSRDARRPELTPDRAPETLPRDVEKLSARMKHLALFQSKSVI